MRIGYFSNINLTKYSNLDKKVNSLVLEAKNQNLGILVCSGGISNNYLITKDFVMRLGNALKLEKIKFRFIVGNKDFYYDKSESCADKEEKFRSILREYRNIEYYLPTHSILLKGGVRIVGFETWYDYSLYRGSIRDLKDITKKSFFGIKNKDVVYITNKSDYNQGLDDLFDIRFSNECLSMMASKLNNYSYSRGIAGTKFIAVQYFTPIKSLLGERLYDKYMGTFMGSYKYLSPLIDYRVKKCIIGCKCVNKTLTSRGIKFIGTDKNITVDEIEVEE